MLVKHMTSVEQQLLDNSCGVCMHVQLLCMCIHITYVAAVKRWCQSSPSLSCLLIQVMTPLSTTHVGSVQLVFMCIHNTYIAAISCFLQREDVLCQSLPALACFLLLQHPFVSEMELVYLKNNIMSRSSNLFNTC